MGRPRGSGAIKLTPEVIDMTLARMANGEVLTHVCREIGVSHGAFTFKVLKDPAFAARYARAREQQAHAMAADVVRIADEEEDAGRARVRTDARKWLAARIDPRNYGDRQQIEVTTPQQPAEDTKRLAVELLQRAFGATYAQQQLPPQPEPLVIEHVEVVIEATAETASAGHEPLPQPEQQVANDDDDSSAR